MKTGTAIIVAALFMMGCGSSQEETLHCRRVCVAGETETKRLTIVFTDGSKPCRCMYEEYR